MFSLLEFVIPSWVKWAVPMAFIVGVALYFASLKLTIASLESDVALARQHLADSNQTILFYQEKTHQMELRADDARDAVAKLNKTTKKAVAKKQAEPVPNTLAAIAERGKATGAEVEALWDPQPVQEAPR